MKRTIKSVVALVAAAIIGLAFLELGTDARGLATIVDDESQEPSASKEGGEQARALIGDPAKQVDEQTPSEETVQIQVTDSDGLIKEGLAFGRLADGEQSPIWIGKSSDNGVIHVPASWRGGPADWLVVEASPALFVKARLQDVFGGLCGPVLRLPKNQDVTLELVPWHDAAKASISVTRVIGGPRVSLPSCSSWVAVPRDALHGVGPSGKLKISLPQAIPLELTPNVSLGRAQPRSIQYSGVEHFRFLVDWRPTKKRVRIGFRIDTPVGAAREVSGRAWFVKRSGSTMSKTFQNGEIPTKRGFRVGVADLSGGVLRVIDQGGNEWQQSVDETELPDASFTDEEHLFVLKREQARAPWTGTAPTFTPKQVVSVTEKGVATSVNTHAYAGTPGAWWKIEAGRVYLGRVPPTCSQIWFLSENGESSLIDWTRARDQHLALGPVGVKMLGSSDLNWRGRKQVIVTFEIKLPNSSQWIRLDSATWKVGQVQHWAKVHSPRCHGRFLLQWVGEQDEAVLREW